MLILFRLINIMIIILLIQLLLAENLCNDKTFFVITIINKHYYRQKNRRIIFNFYFHSSMYVSHLSECNLFGQKLERKNTCEKWLPTVGS